MVKCWEHHSQRFPILQPPNCKQPIKVSFIIPAFNEETLLGETLTSVIDEVERTLCTCEVLVVDNASTDSTAQLAKTFRGVRVITEPVRSLVKARQSGFVAARGELLANIDADTKLPAGWLKRALDEFEGRPRLVALSGPFVYYDLNQCIGILVRLFYCTGYLLCKSAKFFFCKWGMLQGGNFVVRRRALARIGGYRKEFEFYGEDTDLACQLCTVGEVRFSFDLWAWSSGRRLNQEGVVRSGLRYAMNHLWTAALGKPFTRTWTNVR